MLTLVLSPIEASSSDAIKEAVARQLRLPLHSILAVRILKRSVDARQKQIKVLLTVEPVLTEEQLSLPPYPEPVFQDVRNSGKRVVIVGAGPAGLFAALTLLEHGILPILLERGKDVSSRKRDIAQINRNICLPEESNYCFGEGGAGTFSDGKLFSRSKKRGDMQRVLDLFHYFGADEQIRYETHAHIGSEKLPAIIQHIRQTIIEYGGQIMFSTTVKHLLIDNAKVAGVETTDGTKIKCDAVVLAIGHSAHDTYRSLSEQKVLLENKGFAMGVRVEHPQPLIDTLLYHGSPNREYLPAANYSLVTQVGGRGVYSFCMCPGGHIVPAATTEGTCVVNGMSTSKRNSPYANSGIVVEIRPEDIPFRGVLGGLDYQHYLESLAYQNGGSVVVAPAQRLGDFVAGKASGTLPKCSYIPGCNPSRLDQWLPDAIGNRLRQAFKDFDRKYHGFLTNDAMILGVESRTSSAIRIPRDGLTRQHTEVEMLYPCGEGAGYAGGITSSALDGIITGKAVAQKLSK